MVDSWGQRNDAHRVLQARREMLERLEKRLKEIDAELADIDRQARSNQGRVAHPPAVKRAAEDVLLDKANTEQAVAIAKSRAEEANAEYERLNASVGGS